MPIFAARTLQRIEQRSLYPHRVEKVAAGLLYDGIDSFEAEPRYLAKPVRTLPQ